MLTLIVALIALGSVSITSFADQGAKKENVNDGIKTTAKTPANDETVYLLTDADGREHQRIVSEKGTLHYDGYENAELPVTMKISYTLDGKSHYAGEAGREEWSRGHADRLYKPPEIWRCLRSVYGRDRDDSG